MFPQYIIVSRLELMVRNYNHDLDQCSLIAPNSAFLSRKKRPERISLRSGIADTVQQTGMAADWSCVAAKKCRLFSSVWFVFVFWFCVLCFFVFFGCFFLFFFCC